MLIQSQNFLRFMMNLKTFDMTQEEKELLLKDLCARLPYHLLGKDTFGKTRELKVVYPTGTIIAQEINGECCSSCGFVPYLRSMSSITKDEKEEIKPLFSKVIDEFGKRMLVVRQNKMVLYQDWLNAHYFDYRGLIDKGLAIEAPKGMYDTKTE